MYADNLNPNGRAWKFVMPADQNGWSQSKTPCQNAQHVRADKERWLIHASHS